MKKEISVLKKTNNMSCMGVYHSDYCTRCVFCVRCYKCTDCEDCEECIECHFCIECFGLRGAAFRYKNKRITPEEYFMLSNYATDNHVLRRIQKKYKDNCIETRYVVYPQGGTNDNTKYKIINYYRNNPEKILYIELKKGYIKLTQYEGQKVEEIGTKEFSRRPNEELAKRLPLILYSNANNIKEILGILTFSENIN